MSENRAMSVDLSSCSTRNTADDCRRWLLSLGALCAGRMPVEEAKVKIGAYVPMLDDIPASAFNRRTLKEAARRFKWFPSYAEVREVLDEHMREQRQVERASEPREALPPPPIADPEERKAVAAKLRQAARELADHATEHRRPAVQPMHVDLPEDERERLLERVETGAHL